MTSVALNVRKRPISWQHCLPFHPTLEKLQGATSRRKGREENASTGASQGAQPHLKTNAGDPWKRGPGRALAPLELI